jgi:hypothetical protein
MPFKGRIELNRSEARNGEQRIEFYSLETRELPMVSEQADDQERKIKGAH